MKYVHDFSYKQSSKLLPLYNYVPLLQLPHGVLGAAGPHAVPPVRVVSDSGADLVRMETPVLAPVLHTSTAILAFHALNNVSVIKFVYLFILYICYFEAL